MVLAEDETHLQWLPHVRATRTLHGTRHRVATPGTNRRKTVFGALETTTGTWHCTFNRRALGFALAPQALRAELQASRLVPLGWDIAWQRAFRLTHAHLKAGGTLPTATGELIVLGEDLGAWVRAQRHGWDKLLPAQQWLLQSALGLEPLPEDEAVQPARRTQAAAWARNLAAARQYHAREGHLRVPRQHIEHLDDGTEVRLGTWIDNTRRRAHKLSEQRRADLDTLDMRW